MELIQAHPYRQALRRRRPPSHVSGPARERLQVPLGTWLVVASAWTLTVLTSSLIALRGATLDLHAEWSVWALLSSLIVWVIAGVHLVVDHRRQLYGLQTRASELERRLSESRLRMLQTQLQPHFLFNALNTVSAHVEHDARMARLMLERLGELLHCSLETSQEREIELGRELAFLGRYVEFQKIRFADRFDVVLNVQDQVSEALVPPVILQPLVENAIRHGVLACRRKGVIRVDAWRHEERLHLSVRDDGPGLPRGWDLACGGGVGLPNTCERLRQLYGETNHTCAIVNQPQGGVSVELTLPFRSAQ